MFFCIRTSPKRVNFLIYLLQFFRSFTRQIPPHTPFIITLLLQSFRNKQWKKLCLAVFPFPFVARNMRANQTFTDSCCCFWLWRRTQKKRRFLIVAFHMISFRICLCCEEILSMLRWEKHWFEGKTWTTTQAKALDVKLCWWHERKLSASCTSAFNNYSSRVLPDSFHAFLPFKLIS